MQHRMLILVSLFFAIGHLSAQKLSLGYIYPAGGEKGNVVEIEIGGLNLMNTTGVLISGDGVKAEIIPLNQNSKKNNKNRNKGKLDDQSSPQLADRIGVRVTINKKATPGLRDLRLESLSGISNKLNFEVGQYPNQLEQKNSSLLKPNLIDQLPVTLCGQIMPGEIDAFSFKATKGMNLVAAVKARALVPYIADAVPGWFQSVVRLTNSKGKEIAFCDDYRNAVDPVIITKIPENDTYTLSIHDAIYRGREDFNYRIDVGEIPHLDYIFPNVGKIGKKTTITLRGVNLSTKSLTYKPTKAGYGEFKALGVYGFVSNPVPFYGLAKNASLNLFPSNKTELGKETALFDSLSSPYQIKSYSVYAEKNEIIAIEIKARKIGSMSDPKMTLRDDTGKILLISDDIEDATQGLLTFHADPMLQYKVKKTGNYVVEVEDVLGKHGEDYYYLIERKKSIPTYEVFVSPAILTVPKGGTAVLRLDILANDKLVPELEVSIKGLPKDFLVSSLHTQAGTKFWEISISAPQNAKEEKLLLEVQTQARIRGNEELTDMQSAGAADNMMQAFYYTHHIPAADFVADISPASPFSIHLSKEIESKLSKAIPVMVNDTIIPLKIFIDREEGFSESVELNLSKKSKQITMESVTFEPNEFEKEVLIKISGEALAKFKKFRMGLNIVGTVKGVIEKKGQRSFQNAKYREQTPVFILEKK